MLEVQVAEGKEAVGGAAAGPSKETNHIFHTDENWTNLVDSC